MTVAEKVDQYVLNRLYTPLAHWIQIHTGIISYQIARELFLLGLLSACAAPIIAFIVGGVSSIAVAMTMICAYFGLMYLGCFVLLVMHMQMATPWKNEPILVKFLTRAGPLVQVIQLTIVLFYTYLLVSISWNAIERPLPKNPDALEYLARHGAFLLLSWISFSVHTIGTYIVRVRPIPPGDIEEWNKRDAFQGT